MLYANQPTEHSGGYQSDELIARARQAGVGDLPAFEDAVRSGRYEPWVRTVNDAASRSGRQGQIQLVMPDAADDFASSMLQRMDHPVTTCHGPGAREICPLVGGEGCPCCDDAHGIVFALDLTNPTHQDILRNYRTHALGRDLPIRVVVPPGSPPLDALLQGVETWPHNPTIAELDGFACEVEAADGFS